MFRTPRVVAALMLLATIICLAPAASAQTGETETVRLRLEWGSTRPEQWSGVLELSDGAFTATTSLGIGADEPGTLWIDGKSVWLQRRSRRLLDGIDVTVKASARAVLSLTLQSTGSPEVQTRQRFTLDELTHTPRQVTFGKNQARLMIQRAPGTELNVEFERPHLVFSTGESFDLTVSSIQPAGQAGSEQEAARLDWSIDMARSGQSVRSGQMPVVRQRLSDAARRFQYSAKLRLTLPADEGVYDLKLALCQGEQTRRNAVIQVVVVAAGSRADDFRPIDGQAESPVDSFDPAAPGHPRLVGTSEPREFLQKSPRFIGRVLPRRGTSPRHRNSFRRAKSSQVSWSASRLKVRNPGQPHRLVIHAESTGQAGVQGVSLLEPNAAGQLLPVGLDSGFHVAPDATYQLHMVADKPAAETDSSTVRQPVRHEMLFWPKVSDPVLLLHDFGLGRPARVTRVELFELSPEKADTTETRPPAKVRTPGGRLAGPYLHKPLLAAGLGGTQTLDTASGRSLDDWQTFLEPSRRLVQLLRNRGSNACILAVLADAGTIYPSQYLQPAPRYDSGIFFATGQDPVRKDVVELLFRLFGREGLLLIPELQFSTPLPALERQLAAGGGRECGIELTGRDGRTWRQSRGTSRGHAPCYNPLDPRVQEAVLEVVREFVARYRHHPSFGGLSLELGSSGYLQLPGLNWGYDDETIARFEQETGIRVPAEPGAARFQQRHAWLTSHGARQWTQWRCRQVADFHLRLAREITAAHNTSRCLFTGVRLLHGSSVDDSVRDAVIHSLRLDALLAPKGLDFSLYRQEPRVTILRPVLSRVPQARYDVALDHSINHSHLLSKAFQHGDTGALHYHQPLECRIEDFDSVSPWQPAWTWLAAPVVHTGHRIRQSHAASLAELDAQFLFEGSWLVPPGQQLQLQPFRETFRSLPAVPFHAPDVPQPQPAVVRLARHEGKTWLYAVNESDEAVQVRLQFNTSPATSIRRLPAGTAERLVAVAPAESTEPGARPQPAAASRLEFQLEPYGLLAWNIDDPSARVLEATALLPAESIARLRRQLRRLDEGIHIVRDQQESGIALLPSPGFEQGTAGDPLQPAGWTVATTGTGSWLLDPVEPRSGRHSLRLERTADGTAVVSAPLPLDQARMLTIDVWLRGSAAGTPARLSLTGVVDGILQEQSALLLIDQTWRRYSLRVHEVPSRMLADTRIRIGCAGPGRLWIDDVSARLGLATAEDLRQLTKTYSAASLALEDRRYADSRRLLDGYWGRFLFEDEWTRRNLFPIPAGRLQHALKKQERKSQ